MRGRYVVEKDPSAVLDYGFDWSAWLADGDTIASVVWTVPTGITKDNQSESTTIATVWLSGGTAQTQYLVGCKITTAAGRVDERTLTVNCNDR